MNTLFLVWMEKYYTVISCLHSHWQLKCCTLFWNQGHISASMWGHLSTLRAQLLNYRMQSWVWTFSKAQRTSTMRGPHLGSTIASVNEYSVKQALLAMPAQFHSPFHMSGWTHPHQWHYFYSFCTLLLIFFEILSLERFMTMTSIMVPNQQLNTNSQTNAPFWYLNFLELSSSHCFIRWALQMCPKLTIVLYWAKAGIKTAPAWVDQPPKTGQALVVIRQWKTRPTWRFRHGTLTAQWEHNPLSSQNWQDQIQHAKMYKSLVQDQGPKVRLCSLL